MAKKEKAVSVKKEEGAAELKEWHPFTTLREEMDDLLERFEWDWPGASSFGRRRGLSRAMRRLREGWTFEAPDVDVVEKDDAIEVRAELPGMEEKDIDVQLSDRMLTIKGEKKEEREEGEKDSRYHLSERRYGSFERSFRLPEGIDSDKVKANFKNGVLVVNIAKSPELQDKTKKIEVKTG